MKKKYDVIIAGGGTAGCAAAYTAAKAGLSVLLVEKKIHLGGTITSALVTPAMKSSDNQINTEFFDALVSELSDINGQATYQANKGWFNPELTKIALDRLMKKANVEIILSSYISKIHTDKNLIKNINFYSKNLSAPIVTRYVVDATGNCEIGKLLNCNFLETKNELQPVSLRFEMAGIDIKKFSKWLLEFDKDRNVTTVEKINGQTHLSTAYTDCGNWALKPLFTDAVDKGILKPADCKYFQVFTIAGMPNSLSFNCPRVYSEPEINPLDPTDITKAVVSARESILRLADFCKKYLPGFEKAYISNIADELGIRVSRRIKGKYIYTENDLKSGKKFKTPVLIGNYPIDVHSNKDGESVLEHTMQDYQLPVEALQSADYDNLFVVGRCISADFKAQAALRIQPSCFSMGVGAAKEIIRLLKTCE